jgi:CHAT domain-containing protein
MYLGEYEQALAVAAHARAIFHQHNQRLLLAGLEMNVGNIYHRLDQYQEALTFYERARDIYVAHQDKMGLAQISYNCANQYTCLNEFERALRLYQEAGQAYEQLNQPLAVNDVEYSIAWLYFQRGKLQESLKLFVKVRDRARALGNATLEALCDLDLAEVYLQLNAHEDAIESAQAAVEKFRTLGMNYEHAKARMYLGMAHTQGNAQGAAERELQAARRGFLTEGNDVFIALTDIYLSHVLTHRRVWPQALELCIEARAIFHRQGLPVKAAYAELHLARLKLALGEVAEAHRLCQSAWAAIEKMEAPWLKHQCLHLLGNTMEQTGDEAAAYQCYTQAVEYLEELRSTIWVDEFKCTFLTDKLRVYEDLMELCLRAGTQEKIEEALSYAEAAKSRALVDLLAAHQQMESKTPDAAAERCRREWQNIREQLDWFYHRINHYELRPQQRPDQLVPRLREEVHQRERRLAKLARRMCLEDAEYLSLQSGSRPDVAELRRCLAEDEVLVEYYIIAGQVKVFVVSPDGIRLFNDVGTLATTVQLLRKLKFYFDKFTLSSGYVTTHQGKVQGLTEQCLRRLYAELVEPFAPLLSGKKLILVPHGVLHYVPFHALHDGREYLMERHEMSYCPSASVFKLCWEKATRLKEKSPIPNPQSQTNSNDPNSKSKTSSERLEFGAWDWEFPPAGGEVLVMGVPDEAAPLIREEVEAVKSLWPEAQVFLEHEATLDQLKRRAPTCRLLHLASHGVFRRDNPMFSALKLSDAWLSFYDIFNLSLNADLVTLSACETGMNEVFPGDELFGLMRGFLYAGAPSLVVSLWVVHDRSTAEFMRWLYAGLRDGLSKRAALRQAQLRVKQEYQHPYYWAPFILMGAPS